MKILIFVLFFIFFAGALLWAHLYLWRRLVRDTQLPRQWRKGMTLLVVLLGVSGPLVMGLGRLIGRGSLGPLAFVAFTWMGWMFYLVLCLLFWDLLRGCKSIAQRMRRNRNKAIQQLQATSSSSGDQVCDRRVFLARVTAGVSMVASASVTGWGMRAALSDLHTPEVAVRLPRLPAALSGVRLALISDMHLGSVLGKSFTQKVVERTNELKPDLVAITGDLVDASPQMLGEDVAPLRHLSSRWGTYFVTGNHEFYVGADPWIEFLRGLGIQVLENQRVEIGDASGASFDLAGIHDREAGRFGPAYEPDLSKALTGRDAGRELVLLAHQPSQVYQAEKEKVGLQLSGHTHGGQIWPFGGFTRLIQPYLSGLHRHSEDTQIYVTCGTGFWGPPIRVMAPAEITLIVLTS